MAGKKTGKRLLTWVLVLVMALSLLPLNALAKPSEKTDWTADIYAVIVDADNKITSINTLTSKEYSGTTEDFTGKGFKWQWNANGNGGYTISTTITGPNSNVNSSPYMKYPTNLWDYSGKTFEGYTTQNYYPTEGGSVSRMKLNGKGTFDWQWEEDNGVGKNSYSAALALKSKLSVWYVFRDTTPTAPAQDQIPGILGTGFVTVKDTNSVHNTKSYDVIASSVTVGAVSNNQCTVTIRNDEYITAYTQDTKVNHTNAGVESYNVVLAYVNGAWTKQNSSGVEFTAKCDAQLPELPSKTDVQHATVRIQCVQPESVVKHNDSENAIAGAIGKHPSAYQLGTEVKQGTYNGETRYYVDCEITNIAPYIADFNYLYSGHTEATEREHVLKFKLWYCPENENVQGKHVWEADTVPTIYVKCEAAPTEPSKEEVKKLLGDNAVQIICTNDKATHTPKSKGYALIEDSYTSDGVKGDAESGYTYTVTIKSEKYVNQFDTDTGAVHTPKNATATVTLEYKNNAWLVKSSTPISFNVVCDAAPTYPVYVYAFFAHNGTPLKGDVTVNDNDNKIEWNEDANNEYKEYFVTLGVYPNGTTKEPIADATGLDLEALKVTEYEAATSAGSGKANGVALNDITSFPSPYGKVCKGAAGYPEIGEKLSWHLDGQVNVYTVSYNNNDGTAQGAPTSNDYYFGSYTIAAAPKRDGYTFTGWKDSDGTVYDASSKINKLSKDLNLVAQWTARTDLSFTVNYLWNGEAIQAPTTGDNAMHGDKITITDTSIDGYTLIPSQPTSMTIGAGENVLNLNYYKNVTLTANSDSTTYDGKEHSVDGFTATDAFDKPVTARFGNTWPSVKGTDAGTYDVTFAADTENKVSDDNLYIVTAANPGKLTITPRKVTLTSETASKVYDGTPLTRPNVKVTGDGFVDGEVTDIRATGSVTYVSEGEVTNTIKYTPTDKFKADNYDITKTEGKLTITEASAPTPGTFDFNDVVYGDGKVTPAITKTVKGNVGRNFKETFKVTVEPKSDNARNTMTPDYYTGEAKVIASKSLKDVPFLFKPEVMAKAVVPYGELRFTEAGTYTYTVREEIPGKTSRMSYDTTEYTLTIKVVLNKNTNKYEVESWQFTAGNSGYPTPLNIVNTYRTYRPSTPSKPTLNTGDHYAYVMGYPDGTVRPNGSITRAEVSAILFRLLSDKTRDEYFTTESSFTDVKAGAWYNNSIATLEKAGVIVDTAKGGAFRPNEAITRAELAAMLAQFSDAKPVKGVKFSDVSAEHWAYEAIAIAAKMGWIEGYPDGTFRPDATITRAEMMTLVNRALERVPSDEDHLLSKRVMLTFPDCKSGDWFYIAVQEATNSHTYERAATEKNGDEQWTALRANRDWTQLEK